MLIVLHLLESILNRCMPEPQGTSPVTPTSTALDDKRRFVILKNDNDDSGHHPVPWILTQDRVDRDCAAGIILL